MADQLFNKRKGQKKKREAEAAESQTIDFNPGILKK